MLSYKYEDIGDNLDVLDRYDVIITNGSLEYLVNTNDSFDKWKILSNDIHKLLRPGGKWYTTTLHLSDDFDKKLDFV